MSKVTTEIKAVVYDLPPEPQKLQRLGKRQRRHPQKPHIRRKLEREIAPLPRGQRPVIVIHNIMRARSLAQSGKFVGCRQVFHCVCRLLCRLRHEGHRRVDGYGTQKPEADDRP